MIWAVGVGPGDPELLTVRAKALVEAADLVAGFETVLDVVRPLIRSERLVLTYADQADALARVVAAHRAGRRAVVCFMGDPCFSGLQLLERLERAAGEPVPIVPGISAAQIVAARERLAFEEVTFVSFHRRGPIERLQADLLAALGPGRGAIVIPRPGDFTPEAIARFLVERATPAETPVSVYESLTTRESLWRGTLGELGRGVSGRPFGDMSILAIPPVRRGLG